MKIFVDELPKNCDECNLNYAEASCCPYICIISDKPCKEMKKCPLQSLSDYTKQVRKEVCEEIREICKLNIRTYKIQSQDDCERYKEVDAFNKAIFGVLEILDQIQGE